MRAQGIDFWLSFDIPVCGYVGDDGPVVGEQAALCCEVCQILVDGKNGDCILPTAETTLSGMLILPAKNYYKSTWHGLFV